MRRTKKFITLLLTVVMMLSMCLSVGASTSTDDAGEGSITVKNAVDGATYYAFRIFDVTYDDLGNYSYSISVDSEWLEIVEKYTGYEDDDYTGYNDDTGVYKGNGLCLTPSADKTCYVVTTYSETDDDGDEISFSAADFAEYLVENAMNLTRSYTYRTEGENGEAIFDEIELGYYLIVRVATGGDADSILLADLTTTNPDAEVYDKNTGLPFEKIQDIGGDEEEDSNDSVRVGNVIGYTLTSEVPSTDGYTSYTYEISDTMSDGLTFNEDVEVYLVGEDDGEGELLIYSYSDDAELDVENVVKYEEIEDNSGNVIGFTVTIDMMELQNYIGYTVKVTYSATVNENAVTVVSKNNATLKYSDDPNSDSTTEVEDYEEVYSSKIVVYKTADDGEDDSYEGEPLSDATFVLYKLVDNEKYYYVATYDDDGNLTNVDWTSELSEATKFTTDKSGKISIEGLEDGTYYLLETAAPDGYNKLAKEIEISVDGSDALDKEDEEEIATTLTKKVNVENTAGSTLPSTGGMGTTILYILGVVLILGAGVVLVVRRRTSA